MAKSTQALVSTQLIASRILILRGQRVIIDANLAELYGVATKPNFGM